MDDWLAQLMDLERQILPLRIRTKALEDRRQRLVAELELLEREAAARSSSGAVDELPAEDVVPGAAPDGPQPLDP